MTETTTPTTPEAKSFAGAYILVTFLAAIAAGGAWLWAEALRRTADETNAVNGWYDALAGGDRPEVHANLVGPIVLAVVAAIAVAFVGLHAVVRSASRA